MIYYSNNSLSCFSQCPLKYRYKYIAEFEPKKEQHIEAFLGITVHGTLEWLYKEITNNNVPEKTDLLEYFIKKWDNQYNENILILNKTKTKEDYHKLAEKCISKYYDHYQPFNQATTIGIEQHIEFDLNDSENHKIQGYIDRIDKINMHHYEIHDYKTSSRLKTIDQLKTDRQLNFYAMAIKKEKPEIEHIDLIWHYLAFDKEIKVKYNQKFEEELLKNTKKLINKIENTKEFPAKPSKLCDWCDYKAYCEELGLLTYLNTNSTVQQILH